MTLQANSDTGSGLDGQYVPSPSERVRTQVADYEASGGVEGATLEGRPVVILTSVGAKSGKVRKNPMMRIVDGDRYVAVASAGGSPTNPSWYANLVAHPKVRLQDGGSVREFQAREVTGEEKQYYWTVAERFWPHFPEYRRLAGGRDIPIMVLVPIGRREPARPSASRPDRVPTMKISAQFATSLDSPEHIVAAEQVGYDRAWLFDTPHQSPDVWMMLAPAAERTTRIGLGPGVLVPSLRHPMVNASATAALEALAPGRVAVAFGTGFAGTRALGAAPTPWSDLRDYVAAFRALLAGATVLWQGARMQMMHPDGHAPERPIDVPILISALGPKGLAVATELADGLFTVNGQTAFAGRFDWTALGVHGTVLADGESLNSPRVQAASGPGNALAYHAAYEFGGDVTVLPAGDVWLDTINATPPQDRHFAVHDQHLIALNRADTAAWTAGSWKGVTATTLTGTADDVGRRVRELSAQKITEIIYQPSGPDIPGELEAFYAAARTTVVPAAQGD